MKTSIYILLIAVSIASCSKRADDIKVPEKKYLVARSTTTSSVSASSDVYEYNWNEKGLLIGGHQKGASYDYIMAYDYDNKDNITSLRYTNLGSNRWEFTYDAQGRMATQQGYSNDNTKSVYFYQYNYYDDRAELVVSTNSKNKTVYYYSADKSTLTSYKVYSGETGLLTAEYVYTYNTKVKAPFLGNGQISMFKSNFATEKYTQTNYTNGVAGTPITYSYKYQVNSDGYPVSSERSSTENSTIYTTVYEYITQ